MTKLVDFITKLAENPKLLAQFKANPEAVLAKAGLSNKDWERLNESNGGPVGSVVYAVEIDIDEDSSEKRPIYNISYDSPITQLKDIPVKVIEGEDGPYYGLLNGEINDNNGVITMDVKFDQKGEEKVLIVERKCDLQTIVADGKAKTIINKVAANMFVKMGEYPADICGTIDFENGIKLVLQCFPEKDDTKC